MTTYEGTFICSPELPAEGVEEIVGKVLKVIKDASGEVLLSLPAERKRLAYPIKKYFDGNYVYFEFTGTGDIVSLLEKYYKLNENIIRYLTVKKQKKTNRKSKNKADSAKSVVLEEVKSEETR